MSDALRDRIDARLDELLPELIAIRRDLHAHPELGFEEQRTQRVIADFLRARGYAPRECAGTGLVADLGTGRRPRIALRADIDCLPMPEATELPHRSRHPGRAHKCGHDGHVATLLGAADLLARLRDELPGDVRLLFQPAEEGVRGGGARVMLAEGALADVDWVFGQHNWPPFPFGAVRVAAGPVMAAVDHLELRIRGVGGHASEPHRCRDPIVAGAQIVTALQSVASRGAGLAGGGVLSITAFHAGTTHNVIPPDAQMLGTLRTLDPTLRARWLERAQAIVTGVGTGFGVEAELIVAPDYPVLVNDAAAAALVERAAAQVVGPASCSGDGLPLAAAEDFAYFTRACPGAFFFLGAGRDPATPGCHHPDFDFDDGLLPLGVRMFVALALGGAAAQRGFST
jgi:amidohydrolase